MKIAEIPIEMCGANWELNDVFEKFSTAVLLYSENPRETNRIELMRYEIVCLLCFFNYTALFIFHPTYEIVNLISSQKIKFLCHDLNSKLRSKIRSSSKKSRNRWYKKNFYTPNEPQLKNIIKNIFNEVIVKDFILKSTP